MLCGRGHESEGEISRTKRADAFVFSLFHMSVWRNLGAPLQQGVRSHFIFLQLFLQEFHSRTDSFAEVTKNFRKKQGENSHDTNTHHGRNRPFHRSIIWLLRRLRMGTRRRKEPPVKVINNASRARVRVVNVNGNVNIPSSKPRGRARTREALECTWRPA